MDRLKASIKPLGWMLTAASLAYIVNIFLHFDWHLLQFKNPLVSFSFILLFGGWAALFVLAGAYNWKLILEFLGGAPLPARDVFSVYLRSNVAKYLPGNVMHLAGRNFLGSRLGWNNSEIAFSSLLELLFGIGLTGAVLALFFAAGVVTLPAGLPLTVNYRRIVWFLVLAAAGLFFLVLAIYAYRLLVHGERVNSTTAKLAARGKKFLSPGFVLLMGKLLLVSLCSFVANCAFYYYLCDLVLGFQLRSADFFTANAALTLAGFASVLTPGVPGGLGVRESLSILLLTAYGYPKEPVAISMLVFRVACLLGDLIPYFMLKLSGTVHGKND